MPPLRLLAALLLLALVGLPLVRAAAPAAPAFQGRIERLDPAFDALVAPGTGIELLAAGFNWSEGPVWYEGALLFSDVPENVILRWAPGRREAEVFLKPSGLLNPTPGFREPGSNGLARDAQGRLLVCQHGERRVARYEAGRRFNSPNDLALRRNGDIYFTDPPYGLEKLNDSPLKEQPHNGVYRVEPSGRVTLLTAGLSFPNGIGFSPDERRLYVAVSDGRAPRIVTYDVAADGTLTGERLFLDALPLRQPGVRGSCDGLKVDDRGNVWATGPGGVLVLSPEGKLLGRILTGQATGNCAWGDDGGTLYITADMFLLRVRTLVRGAGPEWAQTTPASRKL
jgi:gluconolactonase